MRKPIPTTHSSLASKGLMLLSLIGPSSSFLFWNLLARQIKDDAAVNEEQRWHYQHDILFRSPGKSGVKDLRG
jgi:hypothetical protein